MTGLAVRPSDGLSGAEVGMAAMMGCIRGFFRHIKIMSGYYSHN